MGGTTHHGARSMGQVVVELRYGAAVASDQRVDQVWETPSHDEIVELSRMHVAAMEASTDDMVWCQAGMSHVLLTTIGRTSGRTHKVALPTWYDPDGHRIVVASFAGAVAHPAWFLNIRDRAANPRVRCRVQHGEFWSEHQILEDGSERDRLWHLLVEDRAWYADYQERCQRKIALVRLPETEAIEMTS